MNDKFIVVCQSVVGNGEGFTIDYAWDGEEYDSRMDAIQRGFFIRDSDDFNVAVLSDGVMTSFDWMDEVVETQPHVLSEIAKAIGL